jgi:hypothetical protein
MNSELKNTSDNLANYKTFTSCRFFPEAELTSIVDFGFAPLANSLQKSVIEKAPVAPLHLCFSQKAGCAQLSVTVDPEQLFSEYVWVTGTSATAGKYSNEFCDRLLLECPKAKKVAEVASNDGTFLIPFQQKGLEVLGIDPAQNIAEAANKAGIHTEAKFFSKATATELKKKYGCYDILIARNVLPHVPDSREIIAGIAELIADDGVGAIEFHSARTIFEELHYDSIYHEHVYYLTLSCMCILLKSYGLKAFDIFRSPISGGSIVVLFSKQSRDQTSALTTELLDEEQSGVLTTNGWNRFASRVKEHFGKFNALLKEEKDGGAHLLGYGASARSMTLIHASNTASLIDQIVDNNPLKQNLFSSTGNIPILSSEKTDFQRANTSIVLLAWNFTDELLKLLKDKHHFSGKVIIPLPDLPRVEVI